MKRLAVSIFVLLLIITAPAAAQDETQACDINLVEAIAALSQAQLSADSGNTGAAVETIEAVQAQLADIVSACAQTQAVLDRTYSPPDGAFAVDYPQSWSHLSPTRDVIALSNDQQVLNSAVENDLGNPLAPGSVVVVVGVLDTDETSLDEGDFDDFVAEFQDEGVVATIDLAGPIHSPEIGRYDARAIDIRSDDVEGIIYFLNPDADGQVMVVIGLAPTGEYANFAPVVDAMAASVRYGEDVVVEQAEPASPAPTTVAELPPGKPLDEITYTRAISLIDLNEDINYRTAMLSPDGSMIGWFLPQDSGVMCVYTLADEDTICSSVPEVFHGAPQYIMWSPDSRFITFTQDFVIRFQEADIWLYEVATRQFSNVTDDQINRWRPFQGVGPGDSPGPMWIDIAYAWGPDLNLYFARIELADPSTMDVYTAGIYRLNPDSDETTLIRDITDEFERFAIFQTREVEFDGSLSVSPDAQQIAMIVLEPERDSAKNGIWIMPLDGSAAPRQLVAQSALTPGLIAQSGIDFALPTGLAWSADGRSLYTLGTTIYTGSLDAGAVVYQIDVETGALTPLNDFSAYDRESVLKADDSGYPPAFYIPRAAVMSSDGMTPLVLHALPQDQVAGLSALRFVDGELQPELLLTIDDYMVVPATLSSVARDGKLLLWGYLFLPED
ncbi:MAG: hypothetical protein IT320_19410 [Anaerolineae bacterium]|nr:hypothetical protein [Anaerolineae bacterium]